MYVCMYVCMCVCVYVCMCVCVCELVCIRVRVRICICILCMYMSMSMSMLTHTHTHTPLHTNSPSLSLLLSRCIHLPSQRIRSRPIVRYVRNTFCRFFACKATIELQHPKAVFAANCCQASWICQHRREQESDLLLPPPQSGALIKLAGTLTFADM